MGEVIQRLNDERRRAFIAGNPFVCGQPPIPHHFTQTLLLSSAMDEKILACKKNSYRSNKTKIRAALEHPRKRGLLFSSVIFFLVTLKRVISLGNIPALQGNRVRRRSHHHQRWFRFRRAHSHRYSLPSGSTSFSSFVPRAHCPWNTIIIVPLKTLSTL